SGRRRHTRWPRDWSSDVCSSDLIGSFLIGPHLAKSKLAGNDAAVAAPETAPAAAMPAAPMAAVRQRLDELKQKIAANPKDFDSQIGRASCRERVKNSVAEIGCNR